MDFMALSGNGMGVYGFNVSGFCVFYDIFIESGVLVFRGRTQLRHHFSKFCGNFWDILKKFFKKFQKNESCSENFGKLLLIPGSKVRGVLAWFSQLSSPYPFNIAFNILINIIDDAQSIVISHIHKQYIEGYEDHAQ